MSVSNISSMFSQIQPLMSDAGALLQKDETSAAITGAVKGVGCFLSGDYSGAMQNGMTALSNGVQVMTSSEMQSLASDAMSIFTSMSGSLGSS